ncbi:hypothetical protein JRO89_XS13G0088500 [Xanthoceras sorbifolium]|uniref:DYW domain-containing protein n=1 Tax=Xanthoceras sorbifolium TaxID=99658 RepID=A0ABQ8H7D2_9ROSI|nr:hypothetical protein JRO89_XS13G0088500 [Xanthoceras sorbifolium]
MATTTLHHFPAKTITSAATITQFPENPKTLILQKCKTTKDLNQVHAHLIKTRLHLNPRLTENLLESAAILIPNTTMDYSLSIFHKVNQPDSSAYNVMIRAFTLKQSPQEALILYKKMNENVIQPDHFTFTCTLKACSKLRALREGEQLHAQTVKSGFGSNDFINNTLIHMYANCGKIEVARKVFDGTSKSDVFAWNSMFAGHVRTRRCKEALDVFHDMQMASAEPNEVTFVSVLSSCAVLGALETGKWVHFYVKKKRMELTITLGTALMDFYAKCGLIDSAIEVFNKMPFKNVFSWTVIIQGLANNGHGKRALDFYYLMREKSIEPNEVTFMGVLSACSHVGMVHEGREFFVSMSKDFGIDPRMEHYGCMVDILGRAGLIEEAYQFIMNMPIQPNAVIWRTLIASCRAHKDVEFGEESLKNLVQLEPMNSGDYILLSNIYASVGRWEDAMRVRNQMREKGIKKTPGCSLIELDGEIYEFFAEDSGSPHSKEVYNAAEKMIKKIKSAGYMPNAADARLDAEEDYKEVSVAHHRTKVLVIKSGFLEQPKGSENRYFRNATCCQSNHSIASFLSHLFNPIFIIKLLKRFNGYKINKCHCKICMTLASSGVLKPLQCIKCSAFIYIDIYY